MDGEPRRTGAPQPPTDAERRTSAESERGTGTSVATYAGLGLQLALSIVLFLFLGQWLDGKLGTYPWLTMLGVFVGAGAAFYGMYRRLMADQRREESLRKK